MAVKEITTFRIADSDLSVVVSGSDLDIRRPSGMRGIELNISLTRAEARDLSKALSHAADIVRTKRKK